MTLYISEFAAIYRTYIYKDTVSLLLLLSLDLFLKFFYVICNLSVCQYSYLFMGLTTLTHTNTWTDTNITFSWGTKRFFLCSMVFSRNKNCTTRLPNYSFHFGTRMHAGSSREKEYGLNEKSCVETGFEPQLYS